MTAPSMEVLIHWLLPARVPELEARRRARRECRRERKLGTLRTLWLMLAVSLHAGQDSLHEILRVITAPLGWSVSAPGFCQARKRFSPRQSALALGTPGRRTDRPHWPAPLARTAPSGRRSHRLEPARNQGLVQTLWRA